MNCYLAKIVYQVICGEGKHTPQFDEQLRLIAADNYDDAFEKATDIGLRGEQSFPNYRQQLVQWKFINVCELYCTADYADGAEMYSAIKEVANPDMYIKHVHQKAKQLLQKDFGLLTAS